MNQIEFKSMARCAGFRIELSEKCGNGLWQRAYIKKDGVQYGCAKFNCNIYYSLKCSAMNTTHGSSKVNEMAENEIMIAYLKAKIIALRAEKTVRQEYCMNMKFQVECSVINQTIIQIEAEIIKLEKSK